MMKLGQKVESRRLIRSEDLFVLEITMILGGKKGKYEIKAMFFFREHQVLPLSRAPNFEYPPLHRDLRHTNFGGKILVGHEQKPLLKSLPK